MPGTVRTNNDKYTVRCGCICNISSNVNDNFASCTILPSSSNERNHSSSSFSNEASTSLIRPISSQNTIPSSAKYVPSDTGGCLANDAYFKIPSGIVPSCNN